MAIIPRISRRLHGGGVDSYSAQRMMDRRRELLRSLNDPILGALLDAGSDAERARAIERLVVDVAGPVIQRVISRYHAADSTIAAADADDIVATVRLRLVTRLEAVLLFEDDAIIRFDDYVATVTYNAVYDVLRRRFPERTRLKNRLRYAIGRDPRFRTDTSPKGVVCALAQWPQDCECADAIALDSRSADATMMNMDRPADAVAAVLARAGKPVLMEALLAWIADLWSIAEPQAVEILPETPVATSDSFLRFETRDQLKALLDEIELLPERQRIALLLNLRDPDGANLLPLFIFLGLTTIDRLAALLGMTPERLAELWSRLPLDDTRIAAILGVTRQQVVNLRQAARKRLTRRMAVRNQLGR